MNALDEARIETVEDVADAIVSATGAVLSTYGNDPNSVVIMDAGFALAVDRITKHVDPNFKKIVCELLAQPGSPS